MAIFRYLKILFLVIVAVALVLLFLANNEPVTVRLMPDALANAIGIPNVYTTQLIFVVVGALLIGIIVGFIWEWLREYRFRAEAKTQRREAQRLNQEVAKMKGQSSDTQDDVLAILDQADAAR
ncbi:LapA family protein [Gymnodinialimonas hymeniacidonis]|uniref:LapA family protein n=1 Tax=Gymnodinialimonas hymeniacidonis TaxID=3126508 RepID=UPI0034C62627